MKVTKTTIPSASLTTQILRDADYSDSFYLSSQTDINASPDDILVNIWTDMPGWVKVLFAIRNLAVKIVGLKTGNTKSARDIETAIRQEDSNDLFAIPFKNNSETVMLLKDKHLNAYISILKQDSRSVYCNTLVFYNNNLGRLYFFLIKPFHSLVVRYSVRRAVKNAR